MQVCRTCGEENSDRARFCQACGADLENASRPERQERKVVTVLFCDLVGFTSHSDQADPEDIRRFLRPYHERLRLRIQLFGGTVEKFIGDAVMAVFGAPLAHEDDPERAIRSALALQEAVSDLQGVGRSSLAVRIGIATGEVIASLGARPERGEGIVIGDTVNLAARLQAIAEPGSIVVDQVTQRAAKHVVDFGSIGSVRIKGKREPVPLWRVLTSPSKTAIATESVARAPFVGRKRELALLQDTYELVREGRGPHLVTVLGEPGIGKSRLLSEFRMRVEAQEKAPTWRQGRCLPYGDGIVFWALGEVVKAEAGILDSDGVEQASHKLSAAVAATGLEQSERDWMHSRLSPIVGLSPHITGESIGRAESFSAWRRFLEAVAARGPLVVTFEDIHWADPALLEFINHLIDWSATVPILVLCTARPELHERVATWGGGKRNSVTVMLTPLTNPQIEQLMVALLPSVGLPALVHASLLEKAGGNPLYAEQFVRMLIDRTSLGHEDQRPPLLPVSGILVPESIQSLIGARLDLLPSERKSLLHDAAVVGRVFWSGAVEFMGAMDAQVAGGHLHALSRDELIRPAHQSSITSTTEYSFWHVLVRDVAYSQIPRALRARKHRMAAEWIEVAASDRIADLSEIIVAHYQEALRLAGQADDRELIAGLRAPNLRFLELAGDRAIQLDVSRARDYYQRALEFCSDQDRHKYGLLRKLANGFELDERYEDAESAYLQAVSGYRAIGNQLGTGEAMVELADFNWAHGIRDAFDESLDEAIRILESEPPGRGLALACLIKSRTFWGRPGAAAQCLAWAERGLALAQDVNSADVLVRAMGYVASARLRIGDAARALQQAREALRLALSLGLGAEAGRLYNNVGNWTSEDDPRAGVDLLREGLHFAHRRGLTGDAMILTTSLVSELRNLGQWDEALRRADEVAQSTSDVRFRLDALKEKAQMLIDRGDVEGAASILSDVITQAKRAGLTEELFQALQLASALEWRRGQMGAALLYFDAMERVGCAYWEWHLLVMLPILVSAGQMDRVHQLFDGAERGATLRHQYARVAATAIVAEGEGRLDDSARLYDQAAAAWEQFGYVRDRADALTGAGRCLLQLGRTADAKARLIEARLLLSSLGAQLLINEIDRLIAPEDSPVDHINQ